MMSGGGVNEWASDEEMVVHSTMPLTSCPPFSCATLAPAGANTRAEVAPSVHNAVLTCGTRVFRQKAAAECGLIGAPNPLHFCKGALRVVAQLLKGSWQQSKAGRTEWTDTLKAGGGPPSSAPLAGCCKATAHAEGSKSGLLSAHTWANGGGGGRCTLPLCICAFCALDTAVPCAGPMEHQPQACFSLRSLLRTRRTPGP